MNTSKSTHSKSKLAVIGAAVLVLSGVATSASAEISVWSKWGGLRWCSYNTDTNEGSCWWASPVSCRGGGAPGWPPRSGRTVRRSSHRRSARSGWRFPASRRRSAR